jgi:hypothetical protein
MTIAGFKCTQITPKSIISQSGKVKPYHIRLINKTNDHEIKIYTTEDWDTAKAEFDYLIEMFS